MERIAFSGKAERGSMGVLEYHLTSVPEFRDDSIRVVEQVRVKDDTGRGLRKSERARLFTVDEQGHVAASEPSLWDEIVKTDARPAEPRRPRNTGRDDSASSLRGTRTRSGRLGCEPRRSEPWPSRVGRSPRPPRTVLGS